MTLELRFRRFWFLPDLIQTGNGEPRKAHFLGKKQATPVEKQDQGQRNDQSPQGQGTGKYRRLTSITLGEVDGVMRHFMPQLVASPTVDWIARNYFCELPVRQVTEEQSPVVFGRVNTAYPSEGHVQNIEQMEMYFPGFRAAPDLLNIRRNHIDWHRPIQSYCVGVKMYLSEAEMQDFSQSENIFIERGFAPVYENGYLSLLEMNEQHDPFLWLNVVGSQWFAGIPESVKPEVRERLHDLVDSGRSFLNYHPRRYALSLLSLNDELDFSYGFSKHYLIAPQDTNQSLQKVDQIFNEIFMRGM